MFIIILCLSCVTACSASNDMNVKKYFKDKDARALAKAAEHGDIKKIDALISKGIKVDVLGKHGITPLVWAMVKRNKVSFKHLLEKGASPNVRMEDNVSLLLWATEMDDPYFLDMALKYGGDPNQKIKMFDSEDPLFWYAVSNDRTDNLKTLIKYGVDVNSRLSDGSTLIFCAAELNQYDMVYFLLKKGAKYSLERKYGTLLYQIEKRPVYPASTQHKWLNKVVKFLRDRGVKVTPKEWRREDQPSIINVQTNLNLPQ